MAKIDLADFDQKDESASVTNIEQVGAGRKVLLAVGHEYFVINSKPVVSIRFVCIEDLDEDNDEGNIVTDTFFLNDKAVWRIARYALATGWKEPFDPEVSNELEQVMMAGAVAATIKLERNGEYVNRKVTRYDKSSYGTGKSLKLTDDQKALVKNSESHWGGYLDWRSKNPRTGYKPPAASTKSESYDDIPF